MKLHSFLEEGFYYGIVLLYELGFAEKALRGLPVMKMRPPPGGLRQ